MEGLALLAWKDMVFVNIDATVQKLLGRTTNKLLPPHLTDLDSRRATLALNIKGSLPGFRTIELKDPEAFLNAVTNHAQFKQRCFGLHQVTTLCRVS